MSKFAINEIVWFDDAKFRVIGIFDKWLNGDDHYDLEEVNGDGITHDIPEKDILSTEEHMELTQKKVGNGNSAPLRKFVVNYSVRLSESIEIEAETHEEAVKKVKAMIDAGDLADDYNQMEAEDMVVKAMWEN